MAKKRLVPPEESKIPPPPLGVSPRMWETSQLSLIDKGVPREMVYRIRTLRKMNLWIWLIVIMGHNYKWVLDNEETLLDPAFKRKPGQA